MNKNKVKLGLIGFGNVGRNVYELINRNRENLKERVGAEVIFQTICDINRQKLKKIKNIKTTTKWNEVMRDRSIDIIIELIGGKSPAKEIIIESIKNGKHVVTANKDVLSNNWDEIFKIANERKKLVYFEASVCAGIPIIQALNEGLSANKIKKIVGILNGTTNYILTQMETKGMEFKEALKLTQEKGFAEPDPYIDISGRDTLYKIAILSFISWNGYADLSNIYCEGIENISESDISFAKNEFGYKIKLLGIAKKTDTKFEIQVRPSLIPQNSPFANVSDEYNAILVEGDACKDMMFYGKGAGGEPAASAVVSDIMFLARQVANGIAGKLPYVNYQRPQKLEILDVNETTGYYYLRFTTVDRPGVLAKISDILGKNNVSVACLYQKEPLSTTRKGVPILMLTHLAKEGNLRNAIAEINKLDIVLEKTVFMKIEI